MNIKESKLNSNINNKIAWSLILISVLISFFVIVYSFLNYRDSAVEQSPLVFSNLISKKTEPETTIESTSKIILFGDIMLDRGVEAVINKRQADYSFPFQFVSEKINTYDLAFANLEGSISDQGRDLGNKYSFRFDKESAVALKNAGFDVLSLANNHIWDWGKDSLCASQATLLEQNITGIGAGCNQESAQAPFIYTLPNGVKVGFIAFTNLYPESLVARGDRPGVAPFDQQTIIEQINKLKNEDMVDLVFVSYHWGDEYKTRSNSSQQKIAKELIDNGADVIVGHHPHVVQEVERYGNGWIIYSLGNFIFDQYFSPETMSGLAVEVLIDQHKKTNLNLLPFTLNKDYQPIFD